MQADNRTSEKGRSNTYQVTAIPGAYALTLSKHVYIVISRGKSKKKPAFFLNGDTL